MSNKKIITAIIILILISAGYYLIKENTSFLTFDVPKQEIEKNNYNPDNEPVNNNEPVENNSFNWQLQSSQLLVPNAWQAGELAKTKYLNLPAGFTASVYYSGLNAPRVMVLYDDNHMFVTDKGDDTLVLLTDNNGDQIADFSKVIESNLRTPHGLYLHDGDLYLAEEHQVVVYRNITAEGNYDSKEVLISDLPRGGHTTRTIEIGPDNKIYLSIGSSCNACEEEDWRRSAILRYDLEGNYDNFIAKGLRNTVDFTFQGSDDDLTIWGVNNGRDLLGDDLPPEEVNLIYPYGSDNEPHYGWPYCYGDQVVDSDFPDKKDFCEQTITPYAKMQAHSAPLGIEFVPTDYSWPKQLLNKPIITFHGSWNRTIPTGYKLVTLENKETKNFITGWLEQSGSAWGRPVDVKFDNLGNMYISDDKLGVIYKVTYNETN